jgi:hypothetical protein
MKNKELPKLTTKDLIEYHNIREFNRLQQRMMRTNFSEDFDKNNENVKLWSKLRKENNNY